MLPDKTTNYLPESFFQQIAVNIHYIFLIFFQFRDDIYCILVGLNRFFWKNITNILFLCCFFCNFFYLQNLVWKQQISDVSMYVQNNVHKYTNSTKMCTFYTYFPRTFLWSKYEAYQKKNNYRENSLYIGKV